MTSRLFLSYTLDWVIVIAIIAAASALNRIHPHHRPFPLTDYAIAYPNRRNIVSIPVLIIITAIAPALCIFVLSLVSSRRKTDAESAQHRRWKAALWNIHAGWLGLAAALSSTVFLTTALKDLVGKPRPDFLDRCNADLKTMNLYYVSGNSLSISSMTQPLVTSGICQQKNRHFLDDGFRSFPSGHASFACAGLLYLSLWMSARLAVNIPYLSPQGKKSTFQQTAPPLWQVIVVVAPLVAAGFVSVSRYTDYHQHGFDVIVGMLLGCGMGWASYRLYHGPTRRGRRVAWTARAEEEAFVAVAEESEAEQDMAARLRVRGQQHGTMYTLQNVETARDLAGELRAKRAGRDVKDGNAITPAAGFQSQP